MHTLAQSLLNNKYINRGDHFTFIMHCFVTSLTHPFPPLLPLPFPTLSPPPHLFPSLQRPVVELSVYQSMSLASSGFAFQWSRWNSEVSRSKAVLRVAQLSSSSTPAAAMTSEHLSWTTYLAGRKSYKLTVTEDSEELTLDMQDGCEV